MTSEEFLLARIAEDEAMARDEYRCNTDLRWTPTRVLAECEAKRSLIAWVVEDAPSYDMECGGDMKREVLSRLALPYAEHPEYSESWRP